MSNLTTFVARDHWVRAILAAELPHVVARVGITIAMHLNVDSGRCDPSHKRIADASNIGERSVYRMVEALERAGWLAIERTRGRLSNQYVLLNPAKEAAGTVGNTANRVAGLDANTANSMAGFNTANSMAGLDAAAEPNTAKPAPSTLPNRPSNTANRVADNKRITERENRGRESLPRCASESKGAGDVEAAFERFWQVYPHRVRRHDAQRAFAAVVADGADPEQIIAGARRYVAECAGRERRFVSVPSNWLRGRRWLVEPETVGPIIDQHGERVAAPEKRKPTILDVVARRLAAMGDDDGGEQ